MIATLQLILTAVGLLTATFLFLAVRRKSPGNPPPTYFSASVNVTDGKVQPLNVDVTVNRAQAPWELSYQSGKLFATKEYIEELLPENYGHINTPGTPKKLEENPVQSNNSSRDYFQKTTPMSTSLVQLESLRRKGEPPLDNGWIPVLGLAYQFRKDPLKFLTSQQKKHGDVFTVYIAGRYITFIMDPTKFQYVIRNGKNLDFHQFANEMASRTFDYPLLSEAKFPELTDRLGNIYKVLQGAPLDTLTDSMIMNLQHVFKWKFSQATDWRTENMYQFCCSIMFEASFMTLYGRDPIADGRKVISEMREKFTKFDAKFPYLVVNIPIALLGDTKAIRQELIQFFMPHKMGARCDLAEVIRKRKDTLESYDVLGDYDKAAHHFAFLWASVGNTIPATFWAMYYLVRHPEALAAVRDEIDHLLQSTDQRKSPDHDFHLSRENLDSLVYLGSAINESLRLCSASMNIRVVQNDFQMKLEDGQTVSLRKGDFVALYPPALHRDPEVFEDPEIYKFNRFVENGKEKTTFYKKEKRLKTYLMPFGSGSSICPGRFFAMNEIKQFLTVLLVHFDMELAENKSIGQDNSRAGLGILLPDSDIAFRFRLRQSDMS